MTKLATWNVNSLRVRLEQVLDWVDSENIEILALQETKVIDADFPSDAFLNKGFHVTFSGEKTYNGVAIISREPITDVITDLPNYPDPQRRICAATIGNLRLINLYVPNGSDLMSEKYQYKLNWLQNVHEWLKEEIKCHENLAVVGDFNIAPTDDDVYDPSTWKDCVLVSEPERQAFNSFLELGLYDSFRKHNKDQKLYSWWDYRMRGFKRNLGLRIDHILTNKNLYEKCIDSKIDINPRGMERPSDHAPVWIRY